MPPQAEAEAGSSRDGSNPEVTVLEGDNVGISTLATTAETKESASKKKYVRKVNGMGQLKKCKKPKEEKRRKRLVVVRENSSSESERDTARSFSDSSDGGSSKGMKSKQRRSRGKEVKREIKSSHHSKPARRSGKKTREVRDASSDSEVANRSETDYSSDGSEEAANLDPKAVKKLLREFRSLKREVTMLTAAQSRPGMNLQNPGMGLPAGNGMGYGNGLSGLPSYLPPGGNPVRFDNYMDMRVPPPREPLMMQRGTGRGRAVLADPLRDNPYRAHVRSTDESRDSDGRVDNRDNRRGSRPGAGKRLDFKRVDQVWDTKIHNFRLQDTAKREENASYEDFIFHVRRTFDWEGKYKTTYVDIKSKQLREALQDVIGDVKGVSLVEETPKIDPNMLFLYVEPLREHMRNLKALEPDGKTRKERKKVQKWIDQKRQHLKVLIKYLDQDYAQIKQSLEPLLDNGLITFDLCWALFKPNTLVYTTTYGSNEEPRVFKVESAEKHYNPMRGDFYLIEGKYFEYDGKQFGYGGMTEEIAEFRGARKIHNLNCYPLHCHKKEADVRKDLIERGKKFVSLGGRNYKALDGMAFYKKKKQVIKVNINGRIMVDPQLHRRTNPNYPISIVRSKNYDVVSDNDDDLDHDDELGDSSSYYSSSSESRAHDQKGLNHHGSRKKAKPQFEIKMEKDKDGKPIPVLVPTGGGSDSDTADDRKMEDIKMLTDKWRENEERRREVLPATAATAMGEVVEGAAPKPVSNAPGSGMMEVPEFTDDEYLMASPVILGFAFTERLWLEFSVSGVKDITWNEGAYDSLVLEPKTKDIVKALVESNQCHASENIDDIIQGKGKGLVAVLHGPPGTGKTLTAEGISELLKCPLYCVSAGDLGTDSRYLESELQKILDICHTWGAILLLDEADVFLEKRGIHDVHRNALVSIFLRQLEYFQGILFLTTNRVETFDEAFQSRIHIALRYDELDSRAKKSVFRIFIDRVQALDHSKAMNATTNNKDNNNTTNAGTETSSPPPAPPQFTEEDLTSLARNNLNGREIKNMVITAQALAVHRSESLSMGHLREVLDVHLSFQRDLKGGPGYQDAMRGYM